MFKKLFFILLALQLKKTEFGHVKFPERIPSEDAV